MRRFALTATAALVAALVLIEPSAAMSAERADAGPPARDGRAAAAAAASRPAAAAGATSTVAGSWFSGTIAPGASQGWVWNNANPITAGYEVGLQPVGASTTASCQFQTTRSWYVQQFGGERQFHFIIQNIGTIACGAQIVLATIEAARTWSTPGLDPGASRSWTWNNAFLDAVYHVGLSPTGATRSSPCQFEVTRTRYRRQPDGEKEFLLTVKNVGTIACVADVLLSRATASANFSNVISGGPDGTHAVLFHNETPPVFVPGITPAVGTNTCSMTMVRHWYEQKVVNARTSYRLNFVYDQTAGDCFSLDGTLWAFLS